MKRNMEKPGSKIYYALSVAFLTVGFAFLHMYYVSTLFENDRHFSYLSDLEREMTLRTEMGFYYHYYKTIVEAPSFQQGFNSIIRDNLAEYPNVINALQRFNLYPEIFIGAMYRLFDSVTKYFGISSKQCWEVSRGSMVPSVTSCEGLGDPMYFYLEFVWYAAGLTKAILFLFAVFLSDSLTGGLLTILCFIYNHAHCTRVQWTPPLRESFAYPFCLLQIMTVSCVLRKQFQSKSFSKLEIGVQVWIISITTVVCLLLWQFSQFVIATQTIAVLIMYASGIISRNNLFVIIIGQLIGLLQAFICLYGNELLFQSVLFSLLLSTLCIAISAESQISYFSVRGILVLTAVFGITLSFKTKINQFYGAHDAHIFSILRSKISDFKNFHTMLYTCSPEFDFLPFDTIIDLTKTCLLPTVSTVVAFFVYKWSKNVFMYKLKKIKKKNTTQTEVEKEKKAELVKLRKSIEPEILYNVLQLAAFTIMALFIMRLKLFWTPHLCLCTSLVMSAKYFPTLKHGIRYSIVACLIAMMSYRGIQNIVNQRNMLGEYSNIPFEEVLQWIKTETKPTDVFAGPMSIMANILLSTKRPIVNHPHYEHYAMRDRTLKVYSVFSRQSPEQVYHTFLSLGVDFVVLEESWCFRESRRNCSMTDLWDAVDYKNRHRDPLCPKLFSGNPAPFKRVFSNDVFVILSLKVHQYVELLPNRTFQM